MHRIVLILLLLLTGAFSYAAEQTPGAAYQEYHDALRRSFSVRSIWPHHTLASKARFEQKFPPQFRDKAFYIMRTAAPDQYEIVEQQIDGERAVLRLRARDSSGGLTGAAELWLEKGAWKIHEVVWQRE